VQSFLCGCALILQTISVPAARLDISPKQHFSQLLLVKLQSARSLPPMSWGSSVCAAIAQVCVSIGFMAVVLPQDGQVCKQALPWGDASKSFACWKKMKP
jgi:hypothetical protein